MRLLTKQESPPLEVLLSERLSSRTILSFVPSSSKLSRSVFDDRYNHLYYRYHSTRIAGTGDKRLSGILTWLNSRRRNLVVERIQRHKRSKSRISWGWSSRWAHRCLPGTGRPRMTAPTKLQPGYPTTHSTATGARSQTIHECKK